MNINIVNKQVATKLNIGETKVSIINTYYWQCIKNHLYSYSALPVNIENVCVIFPNKHKIKKAIKEYIFKIRNTKKSTKFRKDSTVYKSYIHNYNEILRKFLAIRKECKFTN